VDASRRWIAGGSVVIIVIACATAAVARAFRPQAVRASNAVGDATCLSCHRQKLSFEQTAHRMTSRPVSRAAIVGSFQDQSNILRTANPGVHFRMDSTASGFYQSAVELRDGDSSTRTERIDIVTGVRKGESYLSWRGDRLYQLPVSQWKGIGWINSPGYRDGVVNFDRPILPRCLECHATSFTSVADTGSANRYDPGRSRLGISCESCHGAGQAHVVRERSPLRVLSTAIVPSGMVNPARLSRARQLDGCALCHAGLGTLRNAAFSYVPGTPLERHLDIPPPALEDNVDVHGNQLELLARSACFLRSGMTCRTCHDVHTEQRDLATFSGRCLSCHTPQSCGLYRQQGQAIVGHCVDCHMPNLTSNTIVSDRNGHEERPQVRSHWIRVYPQSLGR
jgi:hypothetical protein